MSVLCAEPPSQELRVYGGTRVLKYRGLTLQFHYILNILQSSVMKEDLLPGIDLGRQDRRNETSRNRTEAYPGRANMYSNGTALLELSKLI